MRKTLPFRLMSIPDWGITIQIEQWRVGHETLIFVGLGAAECQYFKPDPSLVGGRIDGYADATGGVVLDGRNSKAEEKLVQLIELLRSRYSFGYVSSNQKQDGRFRKIQLKVSPDVEKREGKIAILTRKATMRKTNSANNAQPYSTHC
jgi:hypothetical protein